MGKGSRACCLCVTKKGDDPELEERVAATRVRLWGKESVTENLFRIKHGLQSKGGRGTSYVRRVTPCRAGEDGVKAGASGREGITHGWLLSGRPGTNVSLPSITLIAI